jgi:hypothetical protein
MSGEAYRIMIMHSNPETITIPLKDILDPTGWGDSFYSGQEIFFKAYGESYWDNRYYDPTFGKSVHPNLNPSSVDAVSFIVP